MEYPFQPKSIRSVKRGHFWAIPLDDGRFACGVAVEDRGQPEPLSGVSQTRMFMAALLDWVGTKPPTLRDIETVSQVVDFGYGGFTLISEAGDLIRGRRDMDEYPVKLEDRLTSAGGGRNVLIVNGSNRVRVASRDEAATMPVMGVLGYSVLTNRANNRWGSGQNPTTLPKRAERTPPLRPSPIREHLPMPTGPIEERPPTIERVEDSEPNPRALKILDQAFWNSGGWKRSEVASDDLAYAIGAGLMFDPIDVSHDDAVEWAIEARSAITARVVAAAFVDSLSTRRLDLRSALGSWASTTHLKPHSQDGWTCDTCTYSGTREHYLEDLNVLNFERFKFGGGRHRQPVYAAFDLHQLAQWRQAETPNSLDVLNTILDRWSNLPDSARASDAADALKGAIKSNQNERRVLVEIAALAGILKSDADPPTKRLITQSEQEAQHPGGETDWQYPAHTWRGHMGVDPLAIHEML